MINAEKKVVQTKQGLNHFDSSMEPAWHEKFDEKASRSPKSLYSAQAAPANNGAKKNYS
jgi:hypothetical protein